MPVYFARFGSDGPVKIGWSNNVSRRINGLALELWDEMKIFRVFAGSRKEEFAAHRRFAHLHIKGEWFRFDPSMLGDVDLNEIEQSPSDFLPKYKYAARNTERNPRFLWSEALRAWMIRNNMEPSDVASRVGCVTDTVCAWLINGHLPSKALRATLNEVSKGEMSEFLLRSGRLIPGCWSPRPRATPSEQEIRA